MELISVAGYGLLARDGMRIHDVYFDTPDGSLAWRKMNLRVREAGGSYWVTWKRGQSLLGLWRRRNERRELELSWSQESVSAVRAELEREGVKLQQPRTLDLSDPVETMKSLGLVVLQDRETDRQVRDIALAGGEGVVAELVFDSVVYHFEGWDVRLDELEMEAKARARKSVLEDVKGGLLESIGDELVPWRWGKLVTGRMIERMLRKGALQGLLDGSRLKLDAYDRIRSALETGRF